MKRLLTVCAHVGAAFLTLLAIAAVVPFGFAFHGTVVGALALTPVFLLFSLAFLALSQGLVMSVFRLERPGTLVSFVLGGLAGTAFFAVAAQVVPGMLTCNTLGDAICGGFSGSLLVVVYGLLTGVMDRRILPVRAPKATR